MVFVRPEARGRQPRIRHDVDDPLLLAPQKQRTSNPLWVLVSVFLLLPQQSAHWTPQRQKIGGMSRGLSLSASASQHGIEPVSKEDSCRDHTTWLLLALGTQRRYHQPRKPCSYFFFAHLGLGCAGLQVPSLLRSRKDPA